MVNKQSEEINPFSVESFTHQLNPPSLSLSPSELKTIDRCSMKWFWKYASAIRPRMVSRPLNLGGFMHAVLELYYNPNYETPKHQSEDSDANGLECLVGWERMLKCARTAYRDRSSEGNPVSDDIWQTATSCLRSYCTKYPPDQDWELFGIETEFKIPIFGPLGLVGFAHGRWDAIVKKGKKFHVVDHKTTKRFSFDYLEYDPQADLYALAGAKMFGKMFGGIIYNFIRTKPSKTRANFQRVPVKRSRAEFAFIEGHIARKLIDIGRLDPLRLHFTFTKNCSWDCSYLNLCRRVRRGESPNRDLARSFRKRESRYGGKT